MQDFYKKYKKQVRIGGIALIILIAFAVGTLLGGSDRSLSDGIGAPAIFKTKADLAGRGGSVAGFATEQAAILPPTPDIPASGIIDTSIDRKIILNSSLDLVVKNTEESIEEIKNVAAVHNGVVSNSTVWEYGDEKRGNITIRVPSESFHIAMDAIRDLAVKVTREDINSRDVTEEFIDLEAQLKNYKSVEQQYLKVLDRAWTVEDILSVRKELDRVRNQIERLQGRINYLSRQISMSTITVSLTSEADVKILGIVWNPWLEIKQGVRDMFVGIIGFVNSIIAFAFKLPLLILWVALISAIIWGAWRGFRVIRKKF